MNQRTPTSLLSRTLRATALGESRIFALSALCALVLLSACHTSLDAPPPGDFNSAQLVDAFGRTTALKCPGAQGCEDADGILMVGASSVEITPQVESFDDLNGNGRWDEGESFVDLDGDKKWDPVWLGGSHSGRAATGVHDELWARVITLEKGATSYALVALDLVGINQPDVVAIRRAAHAVGLEFDHIAIMATHQQQGPDTLGVWGPEQGVSGADPEYIAWVSEQIIEALRSARESAQEATLRIGVTETPGLVRDGRLPESTQHLVHTIGFVGVDTRVFASLMVWGNHPETLGSDNTIITSDFPHYAREAMERAYPDSTAVFVNGILGGVTTPVGIVGCPDAMGKEQCAQGSFERAEYVGESLAKKAIESLHTDRRVVDLNPKLGVRRLPFMIGTSNPTLAMSVLTGMVKRRIYAEDGRLLWGREALDVPLSDFLEQAWKFDSEVNALTIGRVQLLLVPGELYSELWRSDGNGFSLVEHPEGADFPQALSEPSFEMAMDADAIRVVVNQSNDSLGHFIPKAQFDEEAPHAYAPNGQKGEENSLGAHAAGIVAEAVYQMFDL